MGEQCNWCGETIDPSDGWRAREHPGARKAAFCRLEHVVPWALRGAHWDAAEIGGDEAEGGSCAQCGAELGDVRILLVRYRGEHRIPDAFCSVDHMADWAKSGGRWR
jgi:hypothetical protein